MWFAPLQHHALLVSSVLLAGLYMRQAAADVIPGGSMLEQGSNAEHLLTNAVSLLREVHYADLSDLPSLLASNERLGPLVVTGLGDKFAQGVLAFKKQAPACLQTLFPSADVRAREMADGSKRLTFAVGSGRAPASEAVCADTDARDPGRVKHA